MTLIKRNATCLINKAIHEGFTVILLKRFDKFISEDDYGKAFR